MKAEQKGWLFAIMMFIIGVLLGVSHSVEHRANLESDILTLSKHISSGCPGAQPSIPLYLEIREDGIIGEEIIIYDNGRGYVKTPYKVNVSKVIK